MRKLLLVLFFTAMGMFKGQSQTLVQTYVDRCTGAVSVFSVPLNGTTVVAFYNRSRSFTSQDFQNGILQSWLEETYLWWTSLSPCSTATTGVQATQQTTQQTTQQATQAATNAAASTANVNPTANVTPPTTTSAPTTTAAPTTTGTAPDTTSTNTSSPDTTSTGTNASSQGNGTTTSGGSENSQTSTQQDTNSTESSTSTEASTTDGNSESTSSDSQNSESGTSGDEAGTEESTEVETTTEESTTEETTTEESTEETTTEESTEESTESETEETTEETTEEESTEETTEEESTEEESETEETDEESSEEESDESSEEESEEESNNEDEEEDDEKEKKKRNLAPPIVTANAMSQQLPTGEFQQAVTFGISQSSLMGTETYGLNAMVYDNFQQYMLTANFSKVHINKEGRVSRVYSASVGGMKMFTTYMAMMNHSWTFLGKKGSVTGVALGTSLTTNELDVIDGLIYFDNQFLGVSLTGFYTKSIAVSPKLSISPMLAVSSPFVMMDVYSKQTMWNTDLMLIGGSSFSYKLTQRFGLNLGANVIESTAENFPTMLAFTIGGRLSF
jgi:hypothetical protein